MINFNSVNSVSYKSNTYKTEKSSQSSNTKNQDILILSGDKDIKSTDSEWVMKPMPKNCWTTPNSLIPLKISNEMQGTIECYYKGNATKEDVKLSVGKAMDDIFNFLVDQHYTTSNDKENKVKVLKETWDEFRRVAVAAATAVSYQEGKKMASQIGEPNDKYWLYYNSDYQYMSEDIKATVLECVQGMSKEMGVDIDFPTTYGDRTDIGSHYESYNIAWATRAKNEVKCGAMLDTTVNPPKGFKFFFKESMYTRQEQDAMLEKQKQTIPDYGLKPYENEFYDGFLQISWGDYSVNGHVPFRYNMNDCNGFNMYALAESFGKVPDNEDVKSFMKNFDFHLRAFYGMYWKL